MPAARVKRLSFINRGVRQKRKAASRDNNMPYAIEECVRYMVNIKMGQVDIRLPFVV